MLTTRIQRAFNHPGYDIWLLDYRVKNGINTSFVAEPIELRFKEMGPEGGAFFPDPTLKIDYVFANELEKAIKQGIDMSGIFNREDFSAEVRAKNENLQDLRKITDALLTSIARRSIID